jgi:isoleucyl-tRNA synthetase
MQFAAPPAEWMDQDLAAKWEKIREVRRVITGALEIERQVKKTIGSSLEAAPEIHVADQDMLAMLKDIDIAEMAITSDAKLTEGAGPADAFRLEDVKGVAVLFRPAQGRKCARSWKISPEVGSDKEFPDITPRDADAVREWQKRHNKMLFG